MDQEQAEIEKRVRAGEWLLTGPVAKLLGIGRTTVHNLIAKGEIGVRKKPGGKQRLCDPKDVLRLLEDSRRIHRGQDDQQSPAD